MPTFKEQVQELTRLKQRHAVWEAIYQLVDEKFISKDGRRVAGIRVPNCVEELVPEETIEIILQEIGEKFIQDIQLQIDSIEDREVVVIREAKASA